MTNTTRSFAGAALAVLTVLSAQFAHSATDPSFAVDDIPQQFYRGDTEDLCRPHPVVRQTDTGALLAEEVDYLVLWTWPEEKMLGTGKVTVVGLGTYAGVQVEKSFEIVEPQSLRALPEGYRPAEYLCSTGTQYIKTGFKPDNNSRADYRFYMYDPFVDDKTASTVVAPFGTRNGGSCQFFIAGARYWHISQYRDDWFSRFGTAQDENVGAYYQNPSVAGEHSFSLNKGRSLIDGVGHPQLVSPFSAEHEAYVFAVNNAGEAKFLPTKMKLYSLQIWDNDTLVRDFVPCVRVADNEPGLYDMTQSGEKAFYANDGAGDFIVGPVMAQPGFRIEPIRVQAFNGVTPCKPHPVVFSTEDGSRLTENEDYTLSWEDSTSDFTGWVRVTGEGEWSGFTNIVSFAITPKLPSDYKPVQYIRSSREQYINTGFKPDNNSRADFHFTMYDFVGLQSTAVPFGIRNGSTSSQFCVIGARYDGWNGYFRRFSNKARSGEATFYQAKPSVAGQHFFSQNRDYFVLDSWLEHDAFAGAAKFEKYFDAYVFAVNNNNEVASMAPMDLYSLKIWDDGTLVRNFVPCVRKADSKPGLWDFVGKSFYANQGTGADFVAGPDLPAIPPSGLALIVR